MAAGEPCTVEGCEKPQHSRGWCPMHYQRWRTTGSLDKRTIEREPCVCGAPRGRRSLCDTCYRKDYYQRNKDRENANAAAYYRANAEKVKDRGRAYREQHPDIARRSYLVHREEQLARQREVRRQNPGRDTAYSREWRKRNPELWALRNRENQRRRSAQNAQPVDYAAILAEHGMVCHICTEPIESRADLHFDHVVPLARGGSHSADNIRPSHALCNLRKGSKIGREAS